MQRPSDCSDRATEATAGKTPIKVSSAIAIAILVIQPLYFYRRVFLYNTVHIPYDIQAFHLPLTWFIARCVRQYSLPLWDPFSYCGVPIHADIQAQLFYPFTWLSILISNLTGGKALFYWLEWQVPLHMMMGGIFAYFLFRKLGCSNWVSFFGASTYELGPFFVSQAQHLGAICSAAWFPLTWLCLCELARKPGPRWLGILTLSIALSLLSGFPATTIVVVVLCGLFLVAAAIARLSSWRMLLVFAGACVLAAMITAIQLVPTLQLAHWSIASIRWQWKADAGGLPWESLASFFWPNYYHIFSFLDPHLYTLPYNYTQMYTYCGHLPLMLILVCPFVIRRNKLLAISAVLLLVSTVWMLGKSTPLYPPLYRIMPKFVQGAIYAEYAMLGFSLFAAATAALVLSRFEPRIPKVVLILGVIASSWSLIRVGSNRGFNTAGGSYRVATESLNNGLPMPETLQRWTRERVPPLRTDFLSPEDYRLRSRAEIDELPTAGGDNPFLPLRYYHLRLTYSQDVFWSRTQLLHSLDSPWTRALNVGFVIEAGSGPVLHSKTAGEYEALDLKNPRIYRVNNPLPRFYLAKRIRCVSNEGEALAVVKDPAFDPTQETVVEGFRLPAVDTGNAGDSVKVVSYENNGVALDVKSQRPGLLVTSEALYPGWVATVNGTKVPIIPTNVAFRGIPIGAGEQRVVMEYRPYGLIIWGVLSAGAVLFTLALMRRA